MDDQTKNLILAFALSLAVLMGWFALFPPPQTDPADSVPQAELLPPPPGEGGGTPMETTADPLTQTVRVAIDTPRLVGSIALTGGRFDDLQLRDYRETVAPDSDMVHLLNPVGGERHPYYALFGWSPRGSLDYDQVPGPNTNWQQIGDNSLTPDSPITLEWDNGAGLTFRRVISVDSDYAFTIDQTVENTGDSAVSLDPYGILAQHGLPGDLQNFFISHEGLVQMADGSLFEDGYNDMRDYEVSDRERTPARQQAATENGWIGFTSKYFMASLMGIPGQGFTGVAQHVPDADIYQASMRQATVTVQPGESASVQSMLFTGAKEFATLSRYEDAGIERFTDAIDWGW
ncbi:MAG: membrane protein insertase YidC, partial [Rhodobacteraceae bacterium]|nr:membrane protein insertase YidC [Paracoccaceae bacterium]